MKNNKKKGAVLITVIMVMTIMMILGTAILQVSLFQVKQASYEDKRLQAQYLARAGAEASLSTWQTAPNGTKPTGDSNTYFLNNANEFVPGTSTNMNIPADKIGKFDVTISKPVATGPDTIIKSVGTVGNVSQTVSVSIKEIITTVPVPPPDWLLGADLGWFDYKSGQIVTGVHTPVANGKVVKIEASKGKGLKLPNKNSDEVTYEADTIVSFSPVQTIHNSIILIAKVISFNEAVDFNKDSGDLTLKVRDTGVDRGSSPSTLQYPITNVIETGPVGVVYFQNTGYYFASDINGIVLRNSNDIATKLIPIPIGDPYYINPYIGLPTQQITSYTILWS